MQQASHYSDKYMIEYFKRILTDSKNIAKISEIFYPFYVLLYDKKYIYHEDLHSIGVMFSSLAGDVLLCTSAEIFLEETAILLKNYSVSDNKISIANVFIENLFRSNIKDAGGFKSFVRIFWLDQNNGHIGSDSTLLNASGATNFTYFIDGYDFSDEEINTINAISTRTKIIDRINAIRSKGADLVFDHVDNNIFRNNLSMLDGALPETIAQLLVEQFNTGERMFSDLSKSLAETNPLGFDKEDAERMYIYKLKHLLTSAALGMMPSKKWSGKYDANGGYLVVKKDGEILCYHFYDKNRFEDFLFKNAYLERAKTRRHGYASLYRDVNGKVYFKLNLQIRLK